jgi:hypothetical protein
MLIIVTERAGGSAEGHAVAVWPSSGSVSVTLAFLSVNQLAPGG